MEISENRVNEVLNKNENFTKQLDLQITDNETKEKFMKDFSRNVSEYAKNPNLDNRSKIAETLRNYGVNKEIFRSVVEALKLPRLELEVPKRKEVGKLQVDDEFKDNTEAKTAKEGFETIKKGLKQDGKMIVNSALRGKKVINALVTDKTPTYAKVALTLGITTVGVAETAARIGIKTAFNVTKSLTKFTAKTIGRTYKAARGKAEMHQEKMYSKKLALGKEILSKAEKQFAEDRENALLDLEGVDIPENVQRQLDDVRAGKLENVETFEASLENGMQSRMAQMREELENVRSSAVKNELQNLGFSQEDINEFLANATVENGKLVIPEPEDPEAPKPAINNEFFEKKNSAGRKVNRELLEKVTKVLQTPSIDELSDEQVAALAESIYLKDNKRGTKDITFDRESLNGDPLLESFADNISGDTLYQEELSDSFSNIQEASDNYDMLNKVLNEVIATHGLYSVKSIQNDLDRVDQMKSGYDEKEAKQGGLKEADKGKRIDLRSIATKKVDMMMKKGLAKVIEDGNSQQKVEIEKSGKELVQGLDKADNTRARKLNNLEQDYKENTGEPEL